MRNDLPPPPSKEDLRAHAREASERLEKISSDMRELIAEQSTCDAKALALGMAIIRKGEELAEARDDLDDAEAKEFAYGVISEEAELEKAADMADARRDYGQQYIEDK